MPPTAVSAVRATDVTPAHVPRRSLSAVREAAPTYAARHVTADERDRILVEYAVTSGLITQKQLGLAFKRASPTRSVTDILLAQGWVHQATVDSIDDVLAGRRWPARAGR